MTNLHNALLGALGTDICELLAQPDTTDVMLNADGRVWVDGTKHGRIPTNIRVEPEPMDQVLRLVAHHTGTVITRERPILRATLQITGERIEATIPPVTEAPTFAIRKPPRTIFALDNFTPRQNVPSPRNGLTTANDPLAFLRQAVTARKNILIAGSTGSGKTSLLSSLMQEPGIVQDRVLVLEDTREIAISSPDHVAMLSSDDVSLRTLVRTAMRYRPDRIIVGEVSDGKAALQMVRALNTGHAGSLCTVHANSAADAMERLIDLCSEETVNAPRRAIATGIHVVVFVSRMPDQTRAICEIVTIQPGTHLGYEAHTVWGR